MKIVLIVLDSVGIGALPDAHLYNDVGANTLGNIAKSIPNFKLPNLAKLGLGNIDKAVHISPQDRPLANYGKAVERSPGKDTITGHWEISGIILDNAFPTFPKGYPNKIIEAFEKEIGRSIIGNVVGSGTDIIERYGKTHAETGFPIVYTSADSVFQVAMHEDIIPLKEQYEICQKARDILRGEFEVARVIARPFVGKIGAFERTTNRRDFAVEPPYPTVLNVLKDSGKEVIGIGKISDIFFNSGITKSIKTIHNSDGVEKTISMMKKDFEGLIFTNLIDFDMHYGHRRDVEGYAQCLEKFDNTVPDILNALEDEDVLIITADHGNDPTASGTDHTREHIPILVYGKTLKKGINIGTRNSFADIGATISEAFNAQKLHNGISFWKTINNADVNINTKKLKPNVELL